MGGTTPTSGSGPARALRIVLAGVSRTLDATGPRFPLYREAGREWVTTDDGNWCAGYWIGLLWLAARHATGSERDRFLSAAYGHIPPMRAQPVEHIFAGLNHAYAGFLGYDVTGDPELRALGLRGADAMVALYNARAQQIPIGIYTTAPPNAQSRKGPVDRRHIAAVDVIHTSLPVLWRAHAETGRAIYREVAEGHLVRHIEWHVRPGGSTTQLTAFDPDTGAPLRRYNTLAATDDGCWSRGLAWNIAGLAAACAHGQTQIVRDPLQRSLRYYAGNSGADLVPAWDMTIRDPSAPRDASAAAIAACGLIGLGADRDAELRQMAGTGRQILNALVASCLSEDEAAPDFGGVRHGCYRFPQGVATDAELIWTDFYLAAALDRLMG